MHINLLTPFTDLSFSLTKTWLFLHITRHKTKYKLSRHKTKCNFSFNLL